MIYIYIYMINDDYNYIYIYVCVCVCRWYLYVVSDAIWYSTCTQYIISLLRSLPWAFASQFRSVKAPLFSSQLGGFGVGSQGGIQGCSDFGSIEIGADEDLRSETLTTKLLKEGKITNKTGGYHPLNHKLPRMVVRPSKNCSTILNVIKIHQN